MRAKSKERADAHHADADDGRRLNGVRGIERALLAFAHLLHRKPVCPILDMRAQSCSHVVIDPISQADEFGVVLRQW
jgi:hypothetical protein